MKPANIKIATGGVLATVVMTMVMFMAPFMGLPKMNVPEMLSGMLHIPLAIGWLMNFMIGIIFAFIYGKLFINWTKKIASNWIKGILYGVSVFVFAQIMMAIMVVMLSTPSTGGNMMLLMIGSLIGHIIYGLAVALIVTEKSSSLAID